MNQDQEPATVQQMDRLARIGLPIERLISSSVANQLIAMNTPTQRQVQCLERFGMTVDRSLRRHEATRLIDQEIQQRRKLEPTPRQERYLRKRGMWQQGMNRGEAYDLIGQMVKRECRQW